MGFDKVKVRQIRGLILFVAAIVMLMIYSKSVLGGIALFVGMIQPFLVGGAIAFVLNLPMRWIETKVLKKWNGKVAAKIKRPVCMVLALVLLLLIITCVIWIVVPQIGVTAKELGVLIPAFFADVWEQLEKLTKAYPEIWSKVQELENIEINWESVISSVGNFLKNGMGNMLTSTVTFASSVIGGMVNFFISFIFAIYILSQKEKLANQGDRILKAYLSEKWYKRTAKVLKLLDKNFGNFISGQCLEAIILGVLFIVAMAVFGFPYAVLVGVLIAFTSLIPVVGAFVGCFVGAFLILINDPVQAVWFVVMFLIIQQLEGNLIYPRVVGSSVGLPSIWVLAAVSVGGSMFGVVGMLCFIPLISTFYSLLREDVNKRNGKKAQFLDSVPVSKPVETEDGMPVKDEEKTENTGKKENEDTLDKQSGEEK